MSVEYIKYKGEKLPIKLGYYTMKMMQQEHGVSMEGDTQGDISSYEPMLYYALKQGHKVEGKEFKYEMEDMVDILDDCFFEFVALIPKFFPTDLEKMMGTGGRATVRKKGQ
jgi:hypothetical protein